MNNIDQIRKSLRSFIRRCLSGITPAQSCILCGQSSSALCCIACEKSLPLSSQNSELRPLCALAFDAVFAKFDFDYPVNHLVHALKYQGHLAVAAWFAEQLQGLASHIHQQHPIHVILPMPLHPRRLATRGFNQSHEIAKRLGMRLGIPCNPALASRRYHLPPQVELGGRDRRKMAADLFDAHADFQGMHLLLVDDVMTTGTTLHTLASTLKRYGAQRVTSLVVASVQQHQTDSSFK